MLRSALRVMKAAHGEKLMRVFDMRMEFVRFYIKAGNLMEAEVQLKDTLRVQQALGDKVRVCQAMRGFDCVLLQAVATRRSRDIL